MTTSSLSELMRELERNFVKHGDMPVSVVIKNDANNPITSVECVDLYDTELDKPVPSLLLFV